MLQTFALKMKIGRKGTSLGLVACGVATLLAYMLYPVFSLFFWRSDLYLPSPEKTVADARLLIAEYRAKKNQDENAWSPYQEHIPESLRIPRMRDVQVHEDHVNFVRAYHPDGMFGVRIWSTDTNFVHEDKPTKYKDVFYFSYGNDFPESPSNTR